ncbi:MAG: GAF domain-containing protein [Thiomonas sp.]|nr:GAF domain-containing protein [Thiomonas sp.]
MTVTLAAIRPCLEGIIPAALASCAEDGTPNVTFVSHVHYVDTNHVALSYQFFNKTRENILANPRVTVQVIHPDTGANYRLALTYLRTENEGPLFESMKARLAGIASHSGMAKVFRLLGSDVYHVLEIEVVPGAVLPVDSAPCCRLEALRLLGARMQAANDLSDLTAALLTGLEQLLDFRHSMVMLLDPNRHVLYTLASCGYAHSGVGAEIILGEGVIGVAAQQRTPIRIGHYTQDYAYSQAVRAGLSSVDPNSLETEIPLPGLPQAQSQIAVPLCHRGQLLGVLFTESERELRFDADDEDTLVVLAQQLAQSMTLLQIRSEEDSAEPVSAVRAASATNAQPLNIRYFPGNNSVFLDGHYLIKGVAGSIFMRLLRDYVADKRIDFSNKELRLDPDLGLPDITDNLEARLILLQRRLDEQPRGIHLEKTGRGRFRLVVMRPILLQQMAESA